MASPDLWPEFTTPDTSEIPARLMRELANKIGESTNGLVVGYLKVYHEPDHSFRIAFCLTSPSLGDYTYRLFDVTHPVEFYSAFVEAETRSYTAENPQQLRDILEEIRISPETTRVINAIAAHVIAPPDVITEGEEKQ